MTNYKEIPLSVPNLSKDILANIEETIESGWVSTGGRFISEFEDKVANYVGVDKAVACQSGTAGLHLAMRVTGIEPGDEVIAPTVTFIAAVNPIRFMGAEPIFLDCDSTLNIDLDKLELFLANKCHYNRGKVINNISGRQIKAITVVHVFGNPINMERLKNIADRYNLIIIEDATEALGSYFTSGRYSGQHCGTIGDIGVYSFNANKIITTGGGGMIVSHNQDLLKQADHLAAQAKSDSLYYKHDKVGYNYRMTNIQASFGTEQIDRLEDFIATKISNYKYYQEAITEIDGLKLLPFNSGTRANHWFYSVLIDPEKYGRTRDELLVKLLDRNIQVRPLWDLIHYQKPYQNNFAYQIDQASHFQQHILNVPCSTNLSFEQIETVLNLLKQFAKK